MHRYTEEPNDLKEIEEELKERGYEPKLKDEDSLWLPSDITRNLNALFSPGIVSYFFTSKTELTEKDEEVLEVIKDYYSSLSKGR